jgi:hypothetical protein
VTAGFRADFGEWMEALAVAQAQTGDAQLTENMLKTVGGVPVPDRRDLSYVDAYEFNAYLRTFVPQPGWWAEL